MKALNRLTVAVCAATAFRDSGIQTDVYYGDRGMKQKMKYAGKCGIPYVAVIGENEAASGTVALKNMQSGEQKNVTIAQAVSLLKI